MAKKPPTVELGRTVIPAGSRIRQWRVKAGMNVAEMAERAGISKRTVERVEASKPTFVYSLNKLAAVFGLTCGELLAEGQTVPAARDAGGLKQAFLKFLGTKAEITIEDVFRFLNQRIEGDGTMEPTDAKDGSTIIAVEMSTDDYVKLKAAFANGSFAKTPFQGMEDKEENFFKPSGVKERFDVRFKLSVSLQRFGSTIDEQMESLEVLPRLLERLSSGYSMRIKYLPEDTGEEHVFVTIDMSERELKSFERILPDFWQMVRSLTENFRDGMGEIERLRLRNQEIQEVVRILGTSEGMVWNRLLRLTRMAEYVAEIQLPNETFLDVANQGRIIALKHQ